MKHFSTFWGATYIVAGTTIGAGMLALPLVSLNIGLTWTLILLVAIWGFMFENALVFVKTCKEYGESVSVAEMAARHLGAPAKFLANIAIIGLFLSLLSAYVAGGSAILISTLDNGNLGEMKNLVTILFSSAMGLILFYDLRITDFYNRVFFGVKIFFFIIVCIMIYRASYSAELYTRALSFNATHIITASGIFFTAFGFHGSIPALLRYMKMENKNLYKAFFVGSLIPLCIYILWIFTCLLGLSQANADTVATLSHQSEPSELAKVLKHVVESPSFPKFVQGFSLLAIITSLLGVAVGLMDFFKEKFSFLGKKKSDVASFTLTKALPLTVALVYPNIFIEALQFAGIALAIIAVILPNAISFKRQLTIAKSTPWMLSLNIINLFIGAIFIVFELLDLAG